MDAKTLSRPLPEPLLKFDGPMWKHCKKLRVIRTQQWRDDLVQKCYGTTPMPKDELAITKNKAIVHLPSKRVVATPDQWMDIQQLTQPRRSRL
jgi:hypothetical protein